QIAKSNLVMEQNSYKNSILTITANLESAKISYDDAERKFQRNQELYAQKLISKEAFENSQKELVVLKARYDQALADSATIPAKFEKIKIYENNIKAAEVSVLKARLALEEARKRMNETKIFSPIDGIILSRNVSFGQIIASATSNVGGGTLLFTIADTSKMYAIADVDESDIGKISIGQSVELTVDTYRNKKFSGVIERIKPEGKTESNITIFKTRININDADKNLLLTGMTANIQIETARAENVLIAPFSAVQTRKGRHFVLAVSNDENDTRPRRIAVEPGVTDGENIEITSDELKEGDKIIAADFSARCRINQSQAGDRPRDPNRELRRMMR
ncbi:MAG TPA: efflux RND transporter periplasmic adaptor subunit, partial [bacterium]|nr:efflux RND transporter periplasmic adaptor subunit [bacterium]